MALSSVAMQATDCAASSAGSEFTGSSTEVIVTARKYAERMVAIPEQLTVLDRPALARQHIDDIRDVMHTDPSFTDIDTGSAHEAPLFMRGVGNLATGDPSVGLFSDGIFHAPHGFANQPFYDLEQVEVLHGMQTGLYGKGTTGGALSVITRAPSWHPEAYLETDLERGMRHRVRGAVSGPLSGAVAARGAFYVEDFAGWRVNRQTGQAIDDARTYAARVSLAIAPTERLRIVPRLEYFNRDQAGFPYRRVRGPRDYTGEPARRDDAMPMAVGHWGASLQMEIELDQCRLTSITADYRSRERIAADLDYSPAPIAFATRAIDGREFSQEIRANGEQGRLVWLIGAYYYTFRDDFAQSLFTGGSGGSAAAREINTGHARTASAFAHTRYALAAHWRLDAELRWDVDHRRQSSVRGSPQVKFNHVSSRVSLSYFWQPHAQLYLSHAQGYRPGGFNDGNAPTFDVEHTATTEAGVKWAMADWMNFNAAWFATRVDDQQAFESDLATAAEFTSNKGDGRINGLELSTLFNPSPALRLTGAVTWLGAEYRDYRARRIGPNGPGIFDLSGNEIQFVPAYAARVRAEYSRPLMQGGPTATQVVFAVSDRLDGPRPWDEFNSAFSRPVHLVNTDIAVQSRHWRADVYVENLLDAPHFTNFVAPFRFPLGSGHALAVDGAPRVYGLALAVDF